MQGQPHRNVSAGEIAADMTYMLQMLFADNLMAGVGRVCISLVASVGKRVDVRARRHKYAGTVSETYEHAYE